MQESMVLDVICTFLMKLAKAKSIAANFGIDDAPSSMVIENLLCETEVDVRAIKDIFLRLEKWKGDVKDEIGVITEQLTNALGESTTEFEFASQLQIVKEKVSMLKTHVILPLKVPPLVADDSHAFPPVYNTEIESTDDIV